MKYLHSFSVAGFQFHKLITMKGYKELEIYKESKRLAIEVHKMTMTLPKF